MELRALVVKMVLQVLAGQLVRWVYKEKEVLKGDRV